MYRKAHFAHIRKAVHRRRDLGAAALCRQDHHAAGHHGACAVEDGFYGGGSDAAFGVADHGHLDL